MTTQVATKETETRAYLAGLYDGSGDQQRRDTLALLQRLQKGEYAIHDTKYVGLLEAAQPGEILKPLNWLADRSSKDDAAYKVFWSAALVLQGPAPVW